LVGEKDQAILVAFIRKKPDEERSRGVWISPTNTPVNIGHYQSRAGWNREILRSVPSEWALKHAHSRGSKTGPQLRVTSDGTSCPTWVLGKFVTNTLSTSDAKTDANTPAMKVTTITRPTTIPSFLLNTWHPSYTKEFIGETHFARPLVFKKSKALSDELGELHPAAGGL
jgi:hypothetical protein